VAVTALEELPQVSDLASRASRLLGGPGRQDLGRLLVLEALAKLGAAGAVLDGW
jgi:hypothetical protein